MSTELIQTPSGEERGLMASALAVSDVLAQVNLIQSVMRAVMKPDEHYGLIPGCGKKPSLWKPGAEKLGFTFRLAPEFEGAQTPLDLGNGHREYVITCNLRHIPTGTICGSGVGSCSTLEGKYRYRVGNKESTGQPVPQEYWTLRKSDPAGAQALIGGPGFSTGKDENGQWAIMLAGEKIEHDNPADYYNTVLKMAKKRAHVDAILTATAASDIFTQDIEDMPEVLPGAAQVTANTTAAPRGETGQYAEPQPKANGAPTTSTPPVSGDENAKRAELTELCQSLADAGWDVSKGNDNRWHVAPALPNDARTPGARANALCVAISAFAGKDGPVAGLPPQSLKGKRLDVTLGTARALVAETHQKSSEQGSLV